MFSIRDMYHAYYSIFCDHGQAIHTSLTKQIFDHHHAVGLYSVVTRLFLNQSSRIARFYAVREGNDAMLWFDWSHANRTDMYVEFV